MKILDLCCGAGGCSMGYHQAGFEPVGVDLKPQKNYPFKFIQGDAIEFLQNADLSEYAFIHASPPCQAYSAAGAPHRKNGKEYPRILNQIRERLHATGKHYIIENVPGAPLKHPVTLCGTMFKGLNVIRHRLFETSFFCPPPGQCNHKGTVKNGDYVTVCGHGSYKDLDKIENWRCAMGINWMTRAEITQAIPPAYTRHIGEMFKTYVIKTYAEAIK